MEFLDGLMRDARPWRAGRESGAVNSCGGRNQILDERFVGGWNRWMRDARPWIAAQEAHVK